MLRFAKTPLAISDHRSDVCVRAGRFGAEQEGETTVTETRQQEALRYMVERKLEGDIEYTRKAIISRARSLAEDLTRLADRLEQDPDAGFNTIGVLQGSGVELDTWCAKLGYQRDALKAYRQAMAYGEEEDTNAG
jgi:hypothetical protein